MVATGLHVLHNQIPTPCLVGIASIYALQEHPAFMAYVCIAWVGTAAFLTGLQADGAAAAQEPGPYTDRSPSDCHSAAVSLQSAAAASTT